MPKLGEVLTNLEPAFQAQVKTLMAKCLADGFRIIPYFGARTPWEQAVLWRQSRTKSQVDAKAKELRSKGAPYLAKILEEVGPQTGPHVTDAPPGFSWHQFRKAIDCYIEHPTTKKALWRDKKLDGASFPKAVALFDRYGEIAEGMGLTWGGPWSIGDYGHVQGDKKSSPLKEYGTPAKLNDVIEVLWPHP